MSLREEDRQKNGCPSRGLGLAAAAIGVGVGAALYYFFSKGPENPASGSSTSNSWGCESPQTLSGDADSSDNSYTTISMNTTTDTSIRDSTGDSSPPSPTRSTSSSEDTMEYDFDDSLDRSSSSSGSRTGDVSASDVNSPDNSYRSDADADDDDDDWEEMENSSNVPHYVAPSHFSLVWLVSPRIRRSRERSWSLEECSICFDVILNTQEVMSLPCTHHFHQACILPWLEQQQTCPNCRKPIE